MSRPLVMGVLNVTPDSFSDGGRYLDPDKAVARGVEMLEEGADVIDVGGESSRPGARPVPEAEELRRVVPVVESLAKLGRVSVDTMKPAVAEAAICAGATLLNDISATLWPLVAGSDVGWVAMHMRGDPQTMQDDPRYEDVVGEVRAFLLDRAKRAADAGVAEVWIDPGIGFGKTDEHNLALLSHIGAFVDSGFPVLVGTSRKGFLGRLGARRGEGPLPVEARLPGSLATTTWAMLAGASMVRVHDVAATVQAAKIVGPARLDGGPVAPNVPGATVAGAGSKDAGSGGEGSAGAGSAGAGSAGAGSGQAFAIAGRAGEGPAGAVSARRAGVGVQ